MTTHPTSPTPPTDTCDVDVLVAGAGPAGTSAALVLGRQQRRVLVVDDGRPRNARAAAMHMYLTRDGAAPADFRAAAHAELTAYAGVSLVEGRVEGAVLEDDVVTATVLAPGGPPSTVRARALLLTSGVRDTLDHLPGLAERWGGDVVHCAYCHGHEAAGRRVVVVSHTPADAMLAAYVADRFSPDVVLATGGLTLPPELAGLVGAAGVRVEETPVRSLAGPPGSPRVELTDGRVLSPEVVFHRPPTAASSLVTDLGCATAPGGEVLVDAQMASELPGVWAAGDAALERGAAAPMAFVAAAVADGQRAAVFIEQRLFLG